MEGKIVTIYDPATQYSGRFNTAQVKPYVRDLLATDANEDWCEIMHETFSKFTTGAGENLSPSFSLHLTEVLTPGDLENFCSMMQKEQKSKDC
jgi:hypothetical protein